MFGIPAGIGILLVTLQAPVKSENGAAIFSSARIQTVAARLMENASPAKAKAVRRRGSRRDMTIAAIALVASGTAMIAVNSAGLASGVTIPPGGERDGYLGKAGVVIGSALVATGIIALVRAHAP